MKKLGWLPKKLTFPALLLAALMLPVTALAATTKTGSTGISGTVPAPPPSRAATIEVPRNGQSFSSLPITVSGLCPANTLVEIYKNNVFAGAANCTNGSYSLQIDLFDGRNDLIARVYDNLNQAGPDSATVTVNFSSPISTGGPRIILTTDFAKRGADPNSILSWPITLSGGTGPYAISVDWGDKTNPDLISQAVPGNLTLQHTYTQSGIYKVTVKATDANGNAAFLQLVAIANGPIKSTGGNANSSTLTVKTKVLIWPLIVLFILMLLAYWLGKRHQLEAIKNRLRKGEPPF
jgi:FlaG/FlaF family flagellin (archaellin)